MTTIKAIIGCNYGDEGKGRMTDYFAYMAAKPCIVVCTNGGAQRGHTVITDEGFQHIFHHFGSGTLAGADTYLPKEYIVNPMIFMQEYRELRNYNFQVYMNWDCLCSTPYDMMINQIIEEARGIHKHGSCGVGIWETILRNGAAVGDMIRMSHDEMYNYLKGVRDSYFANRIKNKKIEISNAWRSIYFSEQLIENYIRDFNAMVRKVKFNTDIVLKKYKTVLFENGQGLLLDQNVEDSEHSTPSNTTSYNIKRIIDDVFDDVDYDFEVCYVTRSYLTRHGNGELLSQIDLPEWIHSEVETNMWNKNQGEFRYGKIDINETVARAQKDFLQYWGCDKTYMSIAVTHIDEYSDYRWRSSLCNIKNYATFSARRSLVSESNY